MLQRMCAYSKQRVLFCDWYW